jgi:hypothetical protein
MGLLTRRVRPGDESTKAHTAPSLAPAAAAPAAAARAPPVSAGAAALAARLRADGDARCELAALLQHPSSNQLELVDWLAARACAAPPAEAARAVARARLDDPAHWAGRYTLFVKWSMDGAHPWDGADGAADPAATLELAALDGGGVAAFLDGAALDFAFEDGVLKTLTSVPCVAPDGSAARVHLHLSFSAGAACAGAYIAPQCHGLLWHDGATHMAPMDWPIAPPRVAGKANVADRATAAAPCALPAAAAFDGEYDTLILPAPSPIDGSRAGAARRGPGLALTGGILTLGGRRVVGAAFSRASVLSWPASPDGRPGGWLHCAHLPAGPLLLGRIGAAGDDSSPAFNFMAECAGAPSVYLTVDALDTSSPLLEAAGLAAAATGELGVGLAATACAWEGDVAAAAIAVAAATAAISADADRALLESAFGPAGLGLVVAPEESVGAARAQESAAEHARAARHAADVAEAAAAVAAACGAAGRAGGAAAKSAAAAFHASCAAASAASAEEAALWAAAHATATRMAGSLYVASVAAASFNDAKDGARAAAAAASDAAAACLGAVQRHLAQLALTTDYAAVKDAADAAAACSAANELGGAVLAAWEAGTAADRATVPELTAAAAAKAAEGARFLKDANASLSESEPAAAAFAAALESPPAAIAGAPFDASEVASVDYESAELALPVAGSVAASESETAAAA